MHNKIHKQAGLKALEFLWFILESNMSGPVGIYPPELVLPGPEETSEQWRIENIDTSNINLSTALQFSAFMVALKVVSDHEKTAPMKDDFTEMRSAGFGVPASRIVNEFSVKGIQEGLHYFPRSSSIECTSKIERRLKFIGSIVRDNAEFFHAMPLHKILNWSSRRLLLPGVAELNNAYTATELREHLDIPSRQKRGRPRTTVSRQRLLMIGSQLLIDNGRPATNSQLRKMLDPETGISVHRLVTTSFGSPSDFWWRLGRNTNQQARGSSPSEAVYTAIRTGIYLHRSRVQAEAASRNRVAPRHLAESFPGGIKAYRKAVLAEKRLIRDILGNEIMPSVKRALLRDYQGAEALNDVVKAHRATLAVLSGSQADTLWIQRLLLHGLNLREDCADIYAMQLEDLKQALKKLKIISVEDRLFVGRLIPAFDEYQLLSNEEIEQLNRKSQDKT